MFIIIIIFIYFIPNMPLILIERNVEIRTIRRAQKMKKKKHVFIAHFALFFLNAFYFYFFGGFIHRILH